MSRCKNCKKRIKWIEIPDPSSLSGRRWTAFNPRVRSEPYRQHVCTNQQRQPVPVRSAPVEEEEKWWQK